MRDPIHNGAMLSVIGRDPFDGTLGIALASTSIAIGSRCPHIDVGHVAVASQGFTNLKVGPLALDLVICGLTGLEVMEALRQHDRFLEYRQIGIITVDGEMQAHTGNLATGWAGHRIGKDVICLGNGLFDDGAELDQALSGFIDTAGLSLAERLLHALECAKSRTGDRFHATSAALLVRSPTAESQIDLRVDLPRIPTEQGGSSLADLRTLYTQYQPLLEIYAARSVTPRPF
jgi:uncharacterized Ntn-hydrolase superfamily protein